MSFIIGSIAAIILLTLFIVVNFKINNPTKIVQRLEPQENNLMKIFTEVYYKGDLIKKWNFDCKFSKVEKRAEEERAEGKALIKLYKKIRN